jgi:hypothetical protein
MSRSISDSFTFPDFVAAVTGVIFTAGLFFYAALFETQLTVDIIGIVLFWVFAPMLVAYELTRRFHDSEHER